MSNKCFNCGQNGSPLFEFIVCDSCKKALRLFTNKTIEMHVEKFTKPAYRKELSDRLIALDKTYIKKRIKILDILEKIEN